MMSKEENELLTRVGPTTPGGKLLRMYWQPVALVEELADQRPVKAVRLLGEDLVLFRDQTGRYGLLDRHCPHRGADLAFGRLQEGGLRCSFHGWLFDCGGNCLETPAEPEGSTFHQRIHQTSYFVVERNGILFAYLGTGEPPAFPALDCFVAPDAYTFAFKGFLECNWLQALEVGVDPSHASFLHRFFKDEDTSTAYGRQFRSSTAGSSMPITRVLREYDRPIIHVEPTDFGLRIVTLRKISDQNTHVRVTNHLFPQAFVIPMSTEMTITQWHVPVDDEHCYWYAIFTSFGSPVDKARMRNQRLELYQPPDYKPRRNKSNDYGFDPLEQGSETYTGMGNDINVHDQWAVESMGTIQDRTREHLGQSDKAIIAYRRLLKRALQQSEARDRPLMVLEPTEAAAITGPAAVDAIGPSEGWEEFWKNLDAQRRAATAWIATSAGATK